MMFRSLLSRKRNPYNTFIATAILALLLLTGCKESPEIGATTVKGKVVNRKSEFVVITDYVNLSDTLKLNDLSEFYFKNETLKAGLFSLIHGNEYQTIFLAPGDNLQVLVDTKTFDESLAFSNGHYKENNYLINLFIEMEKSGKRFMDKYDMAPDAFKKEVLDSSQKRLDQLTTKANQNDFNPIFVKCAQDIIRYNAYNKLERYAVAHHGDNKIDKHVKSLPATYFDYRESVPMDDVTLLNNYSFKAYINALIATTTLDKLVSSGRNDTASATYSTDYAVTRLQVTKSLFKNSTLADLFLYNYARNTVLNTSNSLTHDAILSSFLTLSKNNAQKISLQKLVSSFIKIQTNDALDDIMLTDLKGTSHSMESIVTKMSVIYYWSAAEDVYNMHIHKSVADLLLKYPEIDFIGINLDYPDSSKWKTALKATDSRSLKEYQIAQSNLSQLNILANTNHRAMLVTGDLKIIDPNINLLHYKIETTLLGYLSK